MWWRGFLVSLGGEWTINITSCCCGHFAATRNSNLSRIFFYLERTSAVHVFMAKLILIFESCLIKGETRDDNSICCVHLNSARFRDSDGSGGLLTFLYRRRSLCLSSQQKQATEYDVVCQQNQIFVTDSSPPAVVVFKLNICGVGKLTDKICFAIKYPFTADYCLLYCYLL